MHYDWLVLFAQFNTQTIWYERPGQKIQPGPGGSIKFLSILFSEKSINSVYPFHNRFNFHNKEFPMYVYSYIAKYCTFCAH